MGSRSPYNIMDKTTITTAATRAMPPIPAGMCSMLASAPQWPNFKLVMVLDLRNFQVFFEIHDDMLQAALLVLRIVQGLAQVPALIT